eukprot:Skav204490  [mRNA]  locus=scaffold535:279550:287343:- [translate_table: standard]
MMSYSRAWPTTNGMPAAAGPVPNMHCGQSAPNQSCQPVICQPVQPWQSRQNKETETCQESSTQPYNALEMHEVTGAVESLYADELKPYGRILRKRLAERASTKGSANLDVDIKRLKSVCDACPWIYVQAEEGGDWSALLQNRPLNNVFVDVYSPQDSYPPKMMWQAAEAYFESLDDAHMVLPGGRYSCAQALVSRGLDFLHKRSLGQVCHIVQLAISQKKLLGYLNGAVVPYKRSQSMIKERCAEKQRPCTNTTRSSSSDLADWEKVKTGLKEILFSLSPGTTTIPLSNVKRLFRSRWSQVCQRTPPNLPPHVGAPVSAAAAGAVVASQAMRDAARPEAKGQFFGYDRPMGTSGLYERDRSGDPRPSLRERAPFVQPLSMEVVEANEANPASLMQVPWKPPSPNGSGTLRSRRDHFEASSCSMAGLEEMNLPGGVPNTPLPLMPATPDTPGFPKWSNRMAAPDGLGGSSGQNTFINYPMPPPTPCQGRSQSVPRSLYQRTDDDQINDWSKSDTLSQHPANRLMSAAAAAADPLGPNQKVGHPISAAPGQQPGPVGSQPGFHPQNYTHPGASTIRLADLL